MAAGSQPASGGHSEGASRQGSAGRFLCDERGVPTNWGRWGDEDERGTANLLTARGVVNAARLVRSGRVFSLAAPLSPDGPNLPTRRPTWHIVTTRERASGGGDMSADDVIMMHTHGTTHIDALCHIYVGDTLYNGHPAGSLQPNRANRCGVDYVGPIVSRGVLLDVARFRRVGRLDGGQAIEPDELDACARSQGVEVRAGDVVLVRTGWWQLFGQGADARREFYATEPGPSGACGEWFRARDIVALGADNPGVEAVTSWSNAIPLHRAVIWGCGGYLLEFLDLEALAADGVHEFLFVATPLAIDGGVGSPIAPIAVV
jgi:kynurenine formamidase